MLINTLITLLPYLNVWLIEIRKSPNFLVLSLIFPIVKAPATVPTYWRKPHSGCFDYVLVFNYHSVLHVNVFYSSDMQIMYPHLCGSLYSIKWELCK